MKKTITILLMLGISAFVFANTVFADNPVIKDYFSADPAALEYDGKVYLYTGHDSASVGGGDYVLPEWSIYSSSDMSNWEYEGSVSDDIFQWAEGDSAWASETIEKDGKFYWFTTVQNNNGSGKALGVAVSNNPVTGWEDAIGEPLVESADTENPDNMGGWSWDDIDPTVFIDDDGQAYLYWGNTNLYYAKLKDNMIELDGEIQKVEIKDMPGTFTEAPYVHEYQGKYYLSYAMNWPEDIAYAMSDSPEGPWEYQGKLMDNLPGTGTNHQAIMDFQGEWYFIYHTAALPTGGDYRRSVSIEKMNYNPDGTIQKMIPTASGVSNASYSIQAFLDQNRYIRHLNGELRVDPIEGNTYDSKWHIVDGLADDGEEFVSFQSENNPGFYLVSNGTNLELVKHDGTESFNEDATFKVVPGLADDEWSSYQTYSNENTYVYQQSDFTLGLQLVDSETDKERATFQLSQADVKSIALSTDGVSLQKDANTTIEASVTPNEALQKQVNFYSTDSDVVTVTDSYYDSINGTTTVTVNGIASGTAQIIATSEDGNYSKTIDVEVEAYVSEPIVLKDVVISSNSTTKFVHIEGTLEDQSGKNVTVKVIAPDGTFDYLDQTVTDDTGDFSFDYMISSTTTGTYLVFIGSSDLEEPYESSFLISTEAPEDGDENGEGSGGGNEVEDEDEEGKNDGDALDGDDKETDQNEEEVLKDQEKNNTGDNLPNTATTLFNYLAIGAILFILGAAIIFYVRKRKMQH